MILVTIQYVLYIFNDLLVFLLILNICYTGVGFIIVICVWQGFELHC